jgi:hypothetical protein
MIQHPYQPPLFFLQQLPDGANYPRCTLHRNDGDGRLYTFELASKDAPMVTMAVVSPTVWLDADDRPHACVPCNSCYAHDDIPEPIGDFCIYKFLPLARYEQVHSNADGGPIWRRTYLFKDGQIVSNFTGEAVPHG